MPPLRFIVIHSPGPRWAHGVPLFEQEGLQAHIDHFRTLFEAGKLAMGGPFMDETSGGMMVPMAGIPESEIVAFAAADPAVQSELLVFAIRPWMAAMSARE